jgi:hypothetical protein
MPTVCWWPPQRGVLNGHELKRQVRIACADSKDTRDRPVMLTKHHMNATTYTFSREQLCQGSSEQIPHAQWTI